LDQKGVIVRVGEFALDAEWREAKDRALAALEIPGIVIALGPADTGRFFMRDLVVGLRERGRAVTLAQRADLLEPPMADSALVIEDAGRMDPAMLEAICRTPGRRVVLVGHSAFALPELPAPLTVVTFGPLSPPTAAAPRSFSKSNARFAMASVVLAATCVAAVLVWTLAPRAPLAPVPSYVATLQTVVEPPPAPGSPPTPPDSAPSASEQRGGATSAALPAPLPAGYEDHPGIGASLELPPVPVVAQPDHATPTEPGTPSETAPHLLPDSAPIRVLVSYAPRSAVARQKAAELVRLLRRGGLSTSDAAPAARVARKTSITYFFAEDRDSASRVEHDLGEGFGPSRLLPPAHREPLPRPGTIEVLVPAR
jgi:hypothetical protein